jgi:hypothetical protein
MTQREPQLPQDRFEVLIFTLADHAVTAPDGKLYMNGGGVDILRQPTIPGQMQALSLVMRIRVPWGMTSQPIAFEVLVLDADRNPINPGPLTGGQFEVGRNPGQRPGDELATMEAFTFQGLPIEREGTIYFHLSVDGEERAIIPLKIVRAP